MTMENTKYYEKNDKVRFKNITISEAENMLYTLLSEVVTKDIDALTLVAEIDDYVKTNGLEAYSEPSLQIRPTDFTMVIDCIELQLLDHEVNINDIHIDYDLNKGYIKIDKDLLCLYIEKKNNTTEITLYQNLKVYDNCNNIHEGLVNILTLEKVYKNI